MTAMLDFKDVELYYDHVYALKGVSLSVKQGETVALIGANGAGKSSILRTITGLAPPQTGSVTFEGSRVDGTDPSSIVRRGIAMVPEGRRVFPFMSVKDNLMMGAFTREDKADIQNTLESILTRFPRLKERYNQAAGTLSGGEQQRVAFCRALANQPRLLLADEPTGNLDPETSERVFATLMDVVRETGLSALIATHNLELAARMDRVVRLDAGRIIPAS